MVTGAVKKCFFFYLDVSRIVYPNNKDIFFLNSCFYFILKKIKLYCIEIRRKASA